jgi:hypothetical protein
MMEESNSPPPLTTSIQILGMPRQGTIIRQVQIEDQSCPKKAKVGTKNQSNQDQQQQRPTSSQRPRSRTRTQPKPTIKEHDFWQRQIFSHYLLFYFKAYENIRPLK